MTRIERGSEQVILFQAEVFSCLATILCLINVFFSYINSKHVLFRHKYPAQISWRRSTGRHSDTQAHHSIYVTFIFNLFPYHIYFSLLVC